MRALIDGDILAYEMGGLKKRLPKPDDTYEEICPELEEGEPLPLAVCFAAVENKISDIVKATNVNDYVIYLSSPIDKTWRYNEAKIKPYKGNREGLEKPKHWEGIRTNLVRHYGATVVGGVEADDAMSIIQYQDLFTTNLSNLPKGYTDEELEQCAKEQAGTVICSRDKDLNMVPGWHYSWATGRAQEKPMWWQTAIGGLRVFYKQLLTGDPTDNILGLYGVGAKSSLVTKCDELNTEEELFKHVYKCYQDRFGSYAETFMTENGRLLWMQETYFDRWDRFEDLAYTTLV